MSEQQVGAIIEAGPSDWQIIQQGADGHGEVAVSGRWVHPDKGRVEIRVVFEDSGVAVNHALDWQPAATRADGTWSAVLRVRAGGLYRLETHYLPDNQTAREWAPRGDMRHFLGVGDVWVIAGQSNSAGYGRGPVHDPPELGVHLFRNNEQWALACHPMNESTDTRHPANREAANPAHSPYLHFGRLLKQALGYPIGLVQTALGGSALAPWDPTEPAPAVLFENMVQVVQRAGGKVKGVLWYQGESDSGGEAARTYADRFMRAVKAWRTAFDNPDLWVLTVQLNRCWQPPDPGPDVGWSRVREAQRQVPKRLAGVAVVPAIDLAMSDGIHIGPSGNLLLGERLARAALGMVHGRPVDWEAPDLVSARAVEQGRQIELTFGPVTSRVDTLDPTQIGFRVEDEGGVVPIEKAVYPQDARVLLLLGRPLQGRALVHGGYGRNPAAVPCDVVRFIPILAFSEVPVV